MADLSNQTNLEIMRLNLRKQGILHSKMTMEVRIAEIEEEKRKITENFPIYQKDIADIDATIERLSNPPAPENAE